jgi:hypothetical protein
MEWRHHCCLALWNGIGLDWSASSFGGEQEMVIYQALKQVEYLSKNRSISERKSQIGREIARENGCSF